MSNFFKKKYKNKFLIEYYKFNDTIYTIYIETNEEGIYKVKEKNNIEVNREKILDYECENLNIFKLLNIMYDD